MDAELRALERELAVTADSGVRERLARAFVRASEPGEACRVLGIRWEVDPGSLGKLAWNETFIPREAIARLVRDDVAAVDPAILLRSFPRRADGSLRANTTRFLRKFRAHAAGRPSRRLVLVAWTPGTATLYDRPKDRGSRVLTISLAFRSTFLRKNLLPDSCWRS